MGMIFPAKYIISLEERKDMKKMYVLVSMLVVAVMLLTACGTAATPTAAPVAPATAAPAVPVLLPTATLAPVIPPTPDPLGTDAMPIVMALAPSATSQELQAGGNAIAAKLTELTGLAIKVIVPASYAATVEAMGSGQAQVAFLPILAYMKAKSQGYADVGLVVLRSGSDHYGFEIVANVNRKNPDGTPMFKSFYDATAKKNTADAATALAQFNKKRPCLVEPLSASGYVIPMGVLGKAGVKVGAPVITQGHPQVINAVYLSNNGELCDFGAAYIDARTAVTKTFPNVNNVVQVIYVSDPILPNDNVSFASKLSADMRKKLTDAFVTLASDDAGKALLKSGGYDIGGLKIVDDTFYDDFRAYLEAAGYDPLSYK
jgi:phosphonate transport system substrate-binding protein